MRLYGWLSSFAILVIAGFSVFTSPRLWSVTHPGRDIADNHPPDPDNGRIMFIAGDCATCHASPGQNDALKLGGGRALDTAFGRFYMPNISPDNSDGIGSWTLAQFTRAVREGIGTDGQNLYPAFPYTSYQRMTANDIRDMFAYIRTLEPVPGKAPDHALKFPFSIRRGVGIWRLFFLDGQPLSPPAQMSTQTQTQIQIQPVNPAIERGRYLVEGAGHCAECHSPRNFIGVIRSGMRYGGGFTPDGTGYFPNISQDETGIRFWATSSIVNYLKTGISPINRIAGGDMAEVIENTKKLPHADLEAMAAYLKTIPGVFHPAPGQPAPNYTPQVIMLAQTQNRNATLPTSSAAAISNADTVYVVNTKAFHLNAAASGEEAGKLLATAELRILDRKNTMLKARLDGWQMDGAQAAVYALKSQRIMIAMLADRALAASRRGEAVTDEATGQLWYPVSIELWTDNTGLITVKNDMWAYSADLFNKSCGVCHALPEKEHYLANQWIGNLNAMRRYTSLTPDAYRLLLGYLQNHSKDVNPATGNR